MYKKKRRAILTKKENKFYIVHLNKAYDTNEIGARVFDLCNGRNTKQECIEKIAKLFSVSEKEIESDIDQFLEQLINLELIEAVK